MPLTVIVPAVGCSRSAMTRRNVVLPQPEGPMNETNSPLLMSRLTSESATTSPSLVAKVSPRPLAETTGVRLHPRRRDAGALHGARGGDLLPGRERAVDRVLRLAGDELAVALLGLHLVLDDRHLPARHDEAGQTGDLDALEDVVIDRRLLLRGTDRFLAPGVPDHEVGIGANEDRALPRIEVEDLGDVGRGY